MDEPLIIGDDVFPDATTLPAELRDDGVLDFGLSGDVHVFVGEIHVLMRDGEIVNE